MTAKEHVIVQGGPELHGDGGHHCGVEIPIDQSNSKVHEGSEVHEELRIPLVTSGNIGNIWSHL